MGKNLSAIAAVTSHLRTALFHVNISGIDKQITGENLLAGKNVPKPPKNFGRFARHGASAVFYTHGLFEGSSGLQSLGSDTGSRGTDGPVGLTQTAASTGSFIVAKTAQAADVFRRVENCMITFGLKPTTTTVQRFFFGFYGGTGTIANNDDQLNAIHGFGLAQITTSANYQIAHNDGVGATVYDDTGIAVSTTFRTWVIRAKLDDSGFEWSVDGGAFTSVTTNIPATATNLGYQFIIITNENVMKEVGWTYVYAENDK